jgi:hypothetical protein
MNALCLGKSALLSIQYVNLRFNSPYIILTYIQFRVSVEERFPVEKKRIFDLTTRANAI